MAEVATTTTPANPYLGQQNPYLQNVIDLSSRDMVDNYNRSVAPAQNAAAVRSGSFGNSALGEMAGADQQRLQTSLGDLSSKLRFNDYGQQQGMYQWQQQFDEGTRQYDQNFGRGVFNDAFAQNQQNFQNGLGLMGTLGSQNATDQANAGAVQNTPMNYWQQFANSANALGSGNGTQTSSQGTSSNMLGAALGGAQLGNGLYNYGQNNGWWGGGDSSGITGTGGASGIANYGATPTTNYLS